MFKKKKKVENDWKSTSTSFLVEIHNIGCLYLNRGFPQKAYDLPPLPTGAVLLNGNQLHVPRIVGFGSAHY